VPTATLPPKPNPSADELAFREILRGAMTDKGIDPDLRLAERPDTPTLGDLADDFRRISVLEVGPVPGIEWLRRTSIKLDMATEVQDTLWRAYDRQARDEADHGAYWNELYFLLTGLSAEEKPWDADGMGGSNVSLRVPPDSDDVEQNRSMVFLGSAMALGLEGGFMDVPFPALMSMMKGATIPVASSFVPLMRQIGKDEARHLNIHRYAFHHLRPTQGPDAEAAFLASTNLARSMFRVPAIDEKRMAGYLGRQAPPTTTQVLGTLHLRLSDDT